jgi:hypothetical protein
MLLTKGLAVVVLLRHHPQRLRGGSKSLNYLFLRRGRDIIDVLPIDECSLSIVPWQLLALLRCFTSCVQSNWSQGNRLECFDTMMSKRFPHVPINMYN